MIGPKISEFSEDVVIPLELPEPEVANVILTEWDQIPGGVQRVIKAAQKQGFEVLATYARGPWQEAGSEKFITKQSIAVGGKHPDGRQFRATWTSSNYPRPQKFTFNTAHLPGRPLQPSKILNAYIQGEDTP